MLRKTIIGVLLAYLLILVFCSGALAESKADAEALVKSAEQYYKTNGEDKTIEEISKPDGSFVKEGKSLYIFAYDLEGTMVAHPINPQLIGKNLRKVPDVSGKMYRQEIMEKVAANGEVWVDYKYLNPQTQKIEDKSTYCKKVGGNYIFCCGIYKESK